MSKLIYHPQSMYKSDINDLVEDLVKGGEGSRGGKVIGHTKSGKPIYESANNSAHSSFDNEDHSDAHALHINHATQKLEESESKKLSSKDKKRLINEFENHHKEAAQHRRQHKTNLPSKESILSLSPKALKAKLKKHEAKYKKTRSRDDRNLTEVYSAAHDHRYLASKTDDQVPEQGAREHHSKEALKFFHTLHDRHSNTSNVNKSIQTLTEKLLKGGEGSGKKGHTSFGHLMEIHHRLNVHDGVHGKFTGTKERTRMHSQLKTHVSNVGMKHEDIPDSNKVHSNNEGRLKYLNKQTNLKPHHKEEKKKLKNRVSKHKERTSKFYNHISENLHE